MTPRTVTAVLLAGCAALALASLWIFFFLDSRDDLDDRMQAARQALDAVDAGNQTSVGAPFVAELRAVKSRLDEDARSLGSWAWAQQRALEAPTARLAGSTPGRAECASAWAFDNDELRRAITQQTGIEPPRPSSWPLATATELPEEWDAVLFARAQRRMQLQRILLLAAAAKGAVPRAPLEFRELPRAEQAQWDCTELRLFLRCKDADVLRTCEGLLQPSHPLRLRLTGIRVEAAAANGSIETGMNLDVRLVVERPAGDLP